MLVQFTTPLGAVYMDPEKVTAVGFAHVEKYLHPDCDKPVRLVTVVGGAQYYVFDDPRNMTELLSVK